MEIDQDEGLQLGQRTRDTFQLADVFIKQGREGSEKKQVERFLDLVFGSPFITPTKDEFAMFLARAASMRSASLSRQVGAIITAKNGDLISVGANDVPCFGGGLYWPGKGDQRDYKKGYDSNARERQTIIEDIVKKLNGLPSSDRDIVNKALFDSKLRDITEYGRTVHSEMEALMNCARVGVSPLDGTLYTTLFPSP